MTDMIIDPNNSSNVQELQQYCGGYINATGDVVPYLLKDGSEAPWSKGFICEMGLTCEVMMGLKFLIVSPVFKPY